jgi:hypothetical protein
VSPSPGHLPKPLKGDIVRLLEKIMGMKVELARCPYFREKKLGKVSFFDLLLEKTGGCYEIFKGGS